MLSQEIGQCKPQEVAYSLLLPLSSRLNLDSSNATRAARLTSYGVLEMMAILVIREILHLYCWVLHGDDDKRGLHRSNTLASVAHRMNMSVFLLNTWTSYDWPKRISHTGRFRLMVEVHTDS